MLQHLPEMVEYQEIFYDGKFKNIIKASRCSIPGVKESFLIFLIILETYNREE